jgi:hypothetical protein
MLRELEVEEEKTVCLLRKRVKQQDSIEENELGRAFEEQRSCFDLMARRAERWNNLKDNYIHGFKNNFVKLKGENLKLTYQYNDLFKVSQEYRTTLNHLQERIDSAKNQPPLGRLKHHPSTRPEAGLSFL